VEKAKAYILTNGNSPAFWLIDNLWMPLATSHLTGNRFCLLEQVCATGIGGPPTHTHSSDEGFYVLEGKCTFRAGGVTVEAEAGSFILIPRETEHSFSVDQPQTHVLNFYTPAGFEMILMSIAGPALERKPPPPNAVPIPPRWILEELSREYGQKAVLGMPFVDMPTEQNSVTTASKINPIQPYMTSRDTAPAYWQESILWSVLASSEQTGGAFSLLEELCPMQSGPPPHTHEQDEALYIMDGEITVQTEDWVSAVGAGSLVYIPRGTVHSFRVDSQTARLLNFYLPGGFEQTITTFAQPANALTLPPPNLTIKSDGDRMKLLFERVGMRPVAGPDTLRENKR